MTTFDTLPIILVSAANECIATKVISDLIDNDVSAEYLKDKQSNDRVWRLVNKYYTANVRVHPFADDGTLDVDPKAVEAHLIHITEDELGEECGVVAAERRVAAAAAGAVWRGAALRLVTCGSRSEPAALRAWSSAARAELVPLRAPPDAAARDPPGLQRARLALHAHVWPPARPPRADDRLDSDSSSGEEEPLAEELRAVEQAEAFAAALGALPRAGAGADVGAGAAAGVDAARRERAEALVAAFCRALGYDLDKL